MSAQHRKFWGWGVAEMDLDGPAKQKLAATICERFGLSGLEPDDPPTVAELNLRPPRIKPPQALEEICSTGPEERASHSYGKSVRDVYRAFQRDFSNPPDLVAFPRDEGDIVSLLDERYKNLQRRVTELKADDVFSFFMNAFAQAIEPHTAYLSPRGSENFEISMRLSLEGIGALLGRQTEYTSIARIVPGGPADKDGRLKAGDRVVSVGQDREGKLVDDHGLGNSRTDYKWRKRNSRC